MQLCSAEFWTWRKPQTLNCYVLLKTLLGWNIYQNIHIGVSSQSHQKTSEHQLQWFVEAQSPAPQVISQEQKLSNQHFESRNTPKADRGFVVPVGPPFSGKELFNRVFRFPKNVAADTQSFQSLE
jgi:hypothetical protein